MKPSGEFETFVSDDMPADFPALLESVRFGTGRTRYRRLDVASQIARLHDPVYFGVRESGTLNGAYVLDRRLLLVDGIGVRGVYRGSLCVASAAQGRGIGHALAERGREWVDDRARTEGVPYLSWGCIDDDNHRSLAVLRRQGAERIGGLTMFALYRQWPRERLPLEWLPPERASPSDAATPAKTSLPIELPPTFSSPTQASLSPTPSRFPPFDATFDDCAVRDVTPSRMPALALIDERGVRVGTRVAVSGYRIETMGSALDALVRLTVTPFPPARRRFDPYAFRYVRLSDIVLREGCERDWPAFVSTVLARHGAYFAMTFLDPGSRLHARLREAEFMGTLLHSRRTSIGVMARWSRPEGAGESAALPSGPLALPPVDG